MSNMVQPRTVNDPAAIETIRNSGTRNAGFPALATAMSLIEDLGQELNKFYSKQRDLNRQQQTLVQHTTIAKAYEIFDDKQASTSEAMHASQNQAIASMASGGLSLVGAAGEIAHVGAQPLAQGAGTTVESIVKYKTSQTERNATTLSNTADLKQAAVSTLNRTLEDAQAASREASAKLGEGMRAINEILSGFLSQTPFR